jgi:1-acyl-sn-glycerol-3-phosphate acyltransferase
MLRAVFVFALIAVFLLILGPPLLFVSAVTGNSAMLYRTSVWCARTVLRVAGIQIHMEGREKIPLGCPVVYMCNHQSNCDPPSVVVNLPPVLIMAKKEIFQLPLLGLGMRLLGFIPVDRKSRERALAAVDQAVSSIKNGHSFLAFPEGTRSPNGRLQAFKRGIFVMAIKAGAPIVPISVSGSSKIMRKGEFAIHPGNIKMTIHDPIPTSNMTLEDRGKLTEVVRRSILSGLGPDEQPLAR